MTRSLTIVALTVLITSQAPAQIADSVWTIRGGTFAGTAVHIDTYLASRRSSKFLRTSKLKGDSRFVAWNPSRLPAPVALRPGKISAEDSIEFWSILRRMETDMGMRLFEPATIARDADPDDVIIIDTKNMAGNDGVTFVTWSNTGGLYDVRVFFRSSTTLHDSRTVTHEMMHTLGFGHTSAWISVMNPGSWSPRTLTPDDVAYAQFAFESRAASERLDMWTRLALAVDRERVDTPVDDGYALCSADGFNSEREWPTMRFRELTAAGMLTVVAACGGSRDNKGGDTIAVPAAAVDTTTDRPPGETPRATAAPASGVDTPITRKIGAPAPVRK